MSSARPTAPPQEKAAAAAATSTAPSPSASVDDAAQPTTTTTTTAEPTTRKTRLLKDVEAEENRYIYDSLYKSLDDENDTNIRDHLTVGDTVRQARDAKKEFIAATTLPVKDKMNGCAALMRNLSEEKNKRVAYVFVVYSALILTLPLVMLMLGMHVFAPWWEMDATLCGGGLAVGSALVLVISYVVYAVREDIGDVKLKAQKETEAKKKK